MAQGGILLAIVVTVCLTSSAESKLSADSKSKRLISLKQIKMRPPTPLMTPSKLDRKSRRELAMKYSELNKVMRRKRELEEKAKRRNATEKAVASRSLKTKASRMPMRGSVNSTQDKTGKIATNRKSVLKSATQASTANKAKLLKGMKVLRKLRNTKSLKKSSNLKSADYEERMRRRLPAKKKSKGTV